MPGMVSPWLSSLRKRLECGTCLDNTVVWFTFCFLVSEAQTPKLHSVMGTAIKKPRLLIVEDNPDTRQIYKDVFERDGFEVLLAEDGEKGLSYAQATLPDVILLDLMLPKLGGFDLLKRLRS